MLDKIKEKFKNKKTAVIALAIMGTLLVTAGATYAFFSYSRTGEQENSISSDSIKFHYGEGNRTLSITDAMPMSDEAGKAQTNYFDFDVTAKAATNVRIPYSITVRRKGNDNSLDSAVKFYLTEVTNKGEQNEGETPLTLESNKVVSTFSELPTYTNTALNITAAKNEKLLYVGEVPKRATNYSTDYRLRMWLGNDLNYTQTVTGVCSDTTYTTEADCIAAHKDWTATATTVQKTFTVTVNVYAEGTTESISASSIMMDSGKNLQQTLDELASMVN